MGSSSALWKWRPTEELSSLAGAASLFLSVKEAKVILDSPMWCSSITELRLRNAGIPCDRLYSLFIEDEDLIFGCKKKLLQTFQEAGVNDKDKLLCIAVNCGPALIGDDIEGLCASATGSVPVAIADAGGFNGEFDNGYAQALLAILRKIKVVPCQKIKKTVNILGYSPIERYGKGTLQELKRMLAFCGIAVNYVAGEMTSSIDEVALIGQAEYNIVLNAERGLEAAKWLEEKQGQPYFLAPVPYGERGCRKWLHSIAAAMGLIVPASFERELQELQKEIFLVRMQTFHNDFKVVRCIFSGTYDRVIPIAKAVKDEWENISIYVSISDREGSEEFMHWDSQMKLPELQENSLQILVGTEIDRILLGDIEKTIFISIDDISDSVRMANSTLAGIRGWAAFMEQVFTQYRYFINQHKSAGVFVCKGLYLN